MTRFLAAVIVVFTFFGQRSVSADEEAISEIRSRYQAIENSKLSSKTIEYEPDDEPFHVKSVKYFDGDELVKVVLTFGDGEHGSYEESYYYTEGTTVFAYIAASRWMFTGKTLSNGESETIDWLREDRIYFENGTLIRHLRKEAETTDFDALKNLIRSAENQSVEDAAQVSAVKTRAEKVRGVYSAGELPAVVGG